MTLQPYVLDRETILVRLGGDAEIFNLMLDMYLQDYNSYCVNLDQALAGGQAPLVQREAHTVKGLLATFADEDGTKAAYAIETQAKQGNLAGLETAVADLKTRLHEVAAVLQAHLAG